MICSRLWFLLVVVVFVQFFGVIGGGSFGMICSCWKWSRYGSSRYDLFPHNKLKKYKGYLDFSDWNKTTYDHYGCLFSFLSLFMF